MRSEKPANTPGRARKYITLVIDLASGRIIWVDQGRGSQEAIKGLRWLLLHRHDNLEKDAARRLKRSLALNEPLQCAYLPKEELAELWEQRDGKVAASIAGDTPQRARPK